VERKVYLLLSEIPTPPQRDPNPCMARHRDG
jgi:hypothetical protein